MGFFPLGALLWLRSALRCCGELLGAAGYGGELLRFGDSLEAVVLVEIVLRKVVVSRSHAQGVAAALEDPRPEAVAAYGSGMPGAPNAGEGHG